MRLLGVRLLVTGAGVCLAALLAGVIVFVVSGDAIWLVIALQLVILIGILLGLRATRNAVRALSAAPPQVADSNPVRYASGEPLDLLRRDLQRDVSALIGLYELVDVPGRVPAPGGWAATPETLLALVSEIRRAERIGTVVECGSGTSTVWMALALRERGEGRLVSLEHDEEYAAQTRRRLTELGLDDIVEIRTGRLSEQSLDGGTYMWFDDAILDGLDDVSLLFVDGPPGYLGAMTRYPAFPKLRSQLAENAIVVLDDIDRDEELAVLDAWQKVAPSEPKLELRSMTDRAAILTYGSQALRPTVTA